MGFISVFSYVVLSYTAVCGALFLGAAFTAPQPKQSSAKSSNAGMNQQLSFWARILASVGCLFICSTYGIIASIVLQLFGHGGLSQWTVARAFKYTMWLTTGVWFDIINEGQPWAFGGTFGYKGQGGAKSSEGREWLQTRPAVFVGNHQTELDILVLGTMFPRYTSVTAKSSLKWAPFLGQFMSLSKTVFIDRANRKSAVSTFDNAVRTMKSDRQSVYIFPEGTRSYATSPMLLPFKKGAFHLAIQAQVPIVPVVVANYSHILNFKRKIFRSGRVPMKVLKPFETKGMGPGDVDKLVEIVREAMLNEVVALSQEEGTGLHASGNGEAVSSAVDKRQPIAVAG